ncbi:hypothetical protein FOCC_FOCC011499 [Frankliniella occidentalis]|nr:hypothetical protein FOCC_FOCC011499 [Frankliniella occidentalis]
MHSRERNMIEEHASLFNSELDLFDTTVKMFLEKHEGLHVRCDSAICIANHSKTFDLIEAIAQTVDEEKARCYEDINKFLVGDFKNNAQLEEKNWMQEQTRKLEKEINVILDSHQLRYSEIQSVVETSRITQMDNNEKSFATHKEAILKVTNSFQENLNEVFVKELLIFTDFSSQIKTLKERGLRDMIMNSVGSTIEEVDTCYKLCKESIKNLNNDFQTTVEEQIVNLKRNNLQYLARLRHFSDGGTFSEQEIAKLKSEIVNLEEYAEANKSLQLHQEDLSFTSDVTLLIQKTQSQLKKHTLALKYGGKLLTEQVADLEDEKNNELSDINKKWRYVTQTVTRRSNWLLTKKIEEPMVDKIEASHQSALIIHDENGDFLSLIFHTLAASLQEIEHIVVDFNTKRTDHNNPPNNMHEEAKSFMTGAASKYRLYQEQCLDVWINELAEHFKTKEKAQ